MKPTRTLQTIHADSVSTLSYDPSIPCSHMVWHGFASSQDFRAACLRAYELTRQHRLSKGISDARNLRIISLADQQWFLEEYLPMVLDLRISTNYYSAVLMPKDFFGRQSIDTIADQVENVMEHRYQGIQITTRYFDNEAEARAWLLSLPDENAASQASGFAAEQGSQAA